MHKQTLQRKTILNCILFGFFLHSEQRNIDTGELRLVPLATLVSGPPPPPAPDIPKETGGPRGTGLPRLPPTSKTTRPS